MFKDKIRKLLDKSNIGDRYEIVVHYYDSFGSFDNERKYTIEVVNENREKKFKLLGKNLLISPKTNKLFTSHKEFQKMFLYDVVIRAIEK